MSPINFVGRWFVIVLIVGVSACGGGGGDSPPQLAAPSNVSSADEVPVTLLLQSDIETDSTTFYDTTHDLWNSPAGPVPIQYEDGGYSARQLQVIDDPTETGNKVLGFKLVNPDSAGT